MREDILPAGVLPVAQKLGQLPELTHFYLSGGTALALQLGHRRSRDLDFFSQEPIETLPFGPTLGQLSPIFTQTTLVDQQIDQTHWILDGVQVTYLAYPFPRLAPLKIWQNLKIADVGDIAVQKAYTIGRRAQARDYIDLDAIMSRHFLSLEQIIARAQQVYRDFSPRLFLQQLTYTQDLPDAEEAARSMNPPSAFAPIETRLQAAVHAYVQAALKSPKSPGSLN